MFDKNFILEQYGSFSGYETFVNVYECNISLKTEKGGGNTFLIKNKQLGVIRKNQFCGRLKLSQSVESHQSTNPLFRV